jgi:hypothetical protein
LGFGWWLRQLLHDQGRAIVPELADSIVVQPQQREAEGVLVVVVLLLCILRC